MRRSLALLALVALAGCSAMKSLVVDPKPPPRTQALPRDPAARLAVTFIGHATTLLQLGNKMVLTDPVLTTTVGLISRRNVAPGIDAAHLPALDAVLISHMHFDHLSLGSLELIESKVRKLYVPEGGLVYLTDFSFDACDVAPWETAETDGLRITAVPAQHNGWRYVLDGAWMHAFAGWIVQYDGLTAFFAGDTGYGPHFRAIHARFPHIDLALLPIAPIHPRSFMEHNHMDPAEALEAFADLGADRMVPMHFDTFVNGTDTEGEARETLKTLVAQHGLGDKVSVLEIGERKTLLAR
ncbi:MAG TPA: MBL fold metallo-hydrolase [Polyangiaceae bacterium]